MESLTPPLLLLIWDIKRSMDRNLSCMNGLKFFLERGLQDPFSRSIRHWWYLKSTSTDVSKVNLTAGLQIGQASKMMIRLLEKGTAGESIYNQLLTFEDEVLVLCEDKILNHIALLPLKLQIPLMGLILPASMMLIVVPALALLTV